jgi:hypothetical protein
MIVDDTFNSQFMLYDYIAILNDSTLQILDKNNLNYFT